MSETEERTEEPQERLTAKERTFVEEYLVDLNGTQAAIRAGYSARSAAVIAHENLRKPKIALALDRAMPSAAVSAAPGSSTSSPRSPSPTSARS